MNTNKNYNKNIERKPKNILSVSIVLIALHIVTTLIGTNILEKYIKYFFTNIINVYTLYCDFFHYCYHHR